MFALTLPYRLPNFCSEIRETLGQRQIRQSPGLALNAHSGNEWGKIPVLTGSSQPSYLRQLFTIHPPTSFTPILIHSNPPPPFCPLVPKIFQSLHSRSCPASLEQTPASISTKYI